MSIAISPITIFILDLVLRLALATLVIIRRRPVSTTLAWLVVLVFVPFLGCGLYLLIGENRLGSRRLRAYERLSKSLEEKAVSLWAREHAATEEFDSQWGHIARFGTAVTGLPPLRGNRLGLINKSEEMLETLARDIDSATNHVHLLTYIWMPSGMSTLVADALIRAVARGVSCRVLLDSVGSNEMLSSRECDRLRDGGVKVVAALPVKPIRMLFSRLDLRNHRKIVVIDGTIAYTGSQNISDSTFRSNRFRKTGPWIDATLRIEGPAAHALAITFLRDWMLDSEETLEDLRPFLPLLTPSSDSRSCTVQVVASGPGLAPDAIHQALLTTIYSAREELVMTTPYFVPDDATRTALQAAATRGVHVTIVMPAISDSLLVAAASRSHYLDLLEAGVRIMHYHGGLLHAKTVTVDRRIALIGSANFDARSFWLNFEVSLFIYDDDFASVVRFMQTDYLRQSTEVQLDEWRQRSIFEIFRDNSAKLLGPLL